MTSTVPRGGLSSAARLSLAGIPAIGVAFGFARYGSGLFLPEFREQFGLTVTQLGVLSSGTYAAYLGALVVVAVGAAKAGPRALVVTSGLCATTGLALVAFAHGPAQLVTGLILAGASSGFAWAPYADAVDLALPRGQRDRVLARLPAGTAFAVAVAGPLALSAREGNWRWAWAAFAAIGLAVTLHNARTLPAGVVAAGTAPAPRAFVRRATLPLYSTAFLYGLAGAVYWLFAVSVLGGTDTATAPLFWTLTGLAGTAGLLTGRLFARLGLGRARPLLFGLFTVAIALLGALPGSPVAVALSAVLYGVSFMAISGLLAVWSHRVFPAAPATGFSVTLFVLGVGAVVGPAVLGAFADAYGLPAAFIVTAAISAGALPLRSTNRS